MKIRRVKSVMVPLHEYLTIREDDGLYTAIRALNEAKKEAKADGYKHKSLLVYEKTGRFVVGKISQLDIIRALEPRYRKTDETDQQALPGLSRFGLSPDYLKSLSSQYNLWDQPLESLIEKAAMMTVKDFMYTPSDGEFVDENASLGDAIHQLMYGKHHSLIVMNNGEITGVLRLVDIFSEVCDLVIKNLDSRQKSGG